jgi:hypothetical protein
MPTPEQLNEWRERLAVGDVGRTANEMLECMQFEFRERVSVFPIKSTPLTSGIDPTNSGDRTEEPEVGGAQPSYDVLRERCLVYADALHELSQFMLTRGRVEMAKPIAESVPAATALILELEARCSKLPEPRVRTPTGKLPSERIQELMSEMTDTRGAGMKDDWKNAVTCVLNERLGRAP